MASRKIPQGVVFDTNIGYNVHCNNQSESDLIQSIQEITNTALAIASDGTYSSVTLQNIRSGEIVITQTLVLKRNEAVHEPNYCA